MIGGSARRPDNPPLERTGQKRSILDREPVVGRPLNGVNIMSHGMHTQVEIVQRAIAVFRSEANASEIAELEDEQLAAGSSGLEWYGRTGKVFKRFLVSHSVSSEMRGALEQAIHAVRVILGSAA